LRASARESFPILAHYFFIRMTRLRAMDTRFERPLGVAERAVVTVFRVPPEVAGQRLDVFLRGELHRTSRTRTQAIVRASAYDASGRKLAPNTRVRAEQRILLWRAPWDEISCPSELTIVYEDQHLLVVDKPPMMPVHPTARYYRNTLIKKLQEARPECDFLSLGHRLDRETSGLLIVSKTRLCDRTLKKQFESHEGIDKVYIALTWGIPDRGDRASSFRFTCGMELDFASPLRVKMRAGSGPSSRVATTDIAILESRADESGRIYSLVRCGLRTGRQHQIRLHLATLGSPVVGDKLYGPDDALFARAADGALTDEDRSILELPRHALHAASLSLRHPITGQELVLDAPLPSDIATFWDGVPRFRRTGDAPIAIADGESVRPE
jgi:23S rRNA pseudouridine1911/1915/1917 synthase